MSVQDIPDNTLTLQFVDEEARDSFSERLDFFVNCTLDYMVENIEDPEEAIAEANCFPEPYNGWLMVEWTNSFDQDTEEEEA